MTKLTVRDPTTVSAKFVRWLAIGLVSAFIFLLVERSSAQTVTDIYSFTGQNASGIPSGVTPTQGLDGTLYGTTQGQSTANSGTVFRLSTAGAFKQLYTFGGATGYVPGGGVVLASDGNFYGVTGFGGSSNDGVLFKITSNGIYSVLHEFAGGADGVEPDSPPVEASDGNLYGSTFGNATTPSTIYKYTLISNDFRTIYQLDQVHGSGVAASLIQGADGNLYGTAYQGGTKGCGTIFKVTTSGTPLWSHAFLCAPGGANPVGPLMQASDGNFYGTTSSGGSRGAGTVFKLDQSGDVSTLYNFLGYYKGARDGETPFGGLVQATDGNLYGDTIAGGTSGYGVLFQISTQGAYKLLYNFNNLGAQPTASLLQHTNGLLYGAASGGGRNRWGSIFSLNMGLGVFVTFVVPTGEIGQTVEILGQGLTGATSVTFNGVPATNFRVVKDTYITAVVPIGATTGPVVVTVSDGTLTSNRNFQILGGTPNTGIGKSTGATVHTIKRTN